MEKKTRAQRRAAGEPPYHARLADLAVRKDGSAISAKAELRRAMKKEYGEGWGTKKERASLKKRRAK